MKLVPFRELPNISDLLFRDGKITLPDGSEAPVTPAFWHGSEVVVHTMTKDNHAIISIIKPHPQHHMAEVFQKRGERRQVQLDTLTFPYVPGTSGNSQQIREMPTTDNSEVKALSSKVDKLTDIVTLLTDAMTKPTNKTE